MERNTLGHVKFDEKAREKARQTREKNISETNEHK